MRALRRKVVHGRGTVDPGLAAQRQQSFAVDLVAAAAAISHYVIKTLRP